MTEPSKPHLNDFQMAGWGDELAIYKIKRYKEWLAKQREDAERTTNSTTVPDQTPGEVQG